MSNELYHYFVEGECEKAFIKAFMHAEKGEYSLKPGKVEVFNFVFNKLSPAKALTIKRGTKIVIVYDTDVKQIETFENNLEILINYLGIKIQDIIFVPSVKNFEEEMLYSCSSTKSINDIFNTKWQEDFKNKFINHSDLVSKLYNIGFSFEKMWSRLPSEPFKIYKNSFNQIKIKINN